MNIPSESGLRVPAMPPLTSDSVASLSSTVSTSDSDTSSLAPTLSKLTGTVPDPWNLFSNVTLTLGKGALRFVEYFIIRRRMNSISSKFPHTNNAKFKGIEEMYDDILELSRLDLYPSSIRERSITFLVVQIGSRQTTRLVRHLIQWPIVEIDLFLSEMISVFNPLRLSSKGEKSNIVSAYHTSVASCERHSFEPFVDFLCQIIESGESPTLESGVMDFLLQLYVTNFRDPLASTEPTGAHRQSTLHAACDRLLDIIFYTTNGLDFICGHPLHAIWSAQPHLAFTDSIRNRELRRIEMWQSTTKECVSWRIHSTFAMMLDWGRPFDDSLLVDVAFDLLEFSGSSVIEPNFSVQALMSLHIFLIQGKVQARTAILRYLDLCGYEHCASIMRRIVTCLPALNVQGTPEAKIFFLQWDNDDFKRSAVLHFIHCFFDIARMEPRFLRIMLDANILGLLRPFLEIEGVSGIAHSRELPTVYEPAELGLIGLIRDHGLEIYLPALSEESPHYIVYRRSVMIRAFDIFLYRGDHHPFPEILYSPWDALHSGAEGCDYTSFWMS